jgi:SAM-dependent methyltransferase
MATAARFPFGRNWTNYIAHMNDGRITQAASDLLKLVGDIQGKSFLDIGCGSGIHALAALRLGASRVFSFDYDHDSVAASQEMKRRYAPQSDWQIEQGSVLDESYIRSLGQFDVVYSWGVLMHTGDLWKAMELAALPCEERLVVGIYNDAGWTSRMWQITKRTYSRSGPAVRSAILAGTFVATWGKSYVYNLLRGRPLIVLRRWRDYSQNRGMSAWHDLVDWAGGYPFEFAKPSQVADFYEQRGFKLQKSNIAGGRGINEFTFRKSD